MGSPPPPSLSLYRSPFTSQSAISSSENSSSFSVRANLKLLSPPTIKNQAGCRKGREGEREEGGQGWISQPLSVTSTTGWSHPSFHITPFPCHKPPLTSCSVPAPPWSTHSAALITNCRLPSVGEADHLLQEKANTPLSMARCTHIWSSTVRLYRRRVGRAGGWGLVMQ